MKQSGRNGCFLSLTLTFGRLICQFQLLTPWHYLGHHCAIFAFECHKLMNNLLPKWIYAFKNFLAVHCLCWLDPFHIVAHCNHVKGDLCHIFYIKNIQFHKLNSQHSNLSYLIFGIMVEDQENSSFREYLQHLGQLSTALKYTHFLISSLLVFKIKTSTY